MLPQKQKVLLPLKKVLLPLKKVLPPPKRSLQPQQRPGGRPTKMRKLK